MEVMAPLSERTSLVSCNLRFSIRPSSDNGPTVAWVRKYNENSCNPAEASSAIERSPVGRLLDAIRAEEQALLECGVSISELEHIPGESNDYPDALSRYLSCECHKGETLGEVLASPEGEEDVVGEIVEVSDGAARVPNPGRPEVATAGSLDPE